MQERESKNPCVPKHVLAVTNEHHVSASEVAFAKILGRGGANFEERQLVLVVAPYQQFNPVGNVLCKCLSPHRNVSGNMPTVCSYCVRVQNYKTSGTSSQVIVDEEM